MTGYRKCFFAALTLLVSIVMVLSGCSNEKPLADETGPVIQWNWKNRITGLTVEIDHVWLAPKRMETDTTAYMFLDKQERAVVIFGVEEYPDMDLRGYVDALMISNTNSMEIPEEGEYGVYRGYPAWVGHGNLVKNTKHKVTVRVLKSGGAFWRTITVQAPPYEASEDLVKRHEERVWNTIIPALKDGKVDPY